MGAIIDKQDIFSEVKLEDEMYYQMNLIKLEDLQAIPIEEVKKKVRQKIKQILIDSEINGIGEELNISEFESKLVDTIIANPEDFSESSRRNTRFMRPR